MIKRTLGILTVSTLLVSGCGGPTEPRPLVTAGLNVLESVFILVKMGPLGLWRGCDDQT